MATKYLKDLVMVVAVAALDSFKNMSWIFKSLSTATAAATTTYLL